MLFMIIGSTLGGYLPVFFGVESFSLTALFGSLIGGALGIWLAIRLFS
jgi:uncharacterized membrane protein YeaQ/YmgE (transglycosylase-associated protein family)